MGRLMNKTEAGKHLGVSAKTVKRYTAAGILPCIEMPGFRTLYDVDDLDKAFTSGLSTTAKVIHAFRRRKAS